MKSRGILMTTVMVEALLRGAKTQTRRGRGLKKINESPNDWVYKWIDVKEDGLYARFESTKGLPHLSIKCPYGFVEDRLWVRETFVYVTYPFATTENVLFWADGKTKRLPNGTFKEGQLVHNLESDDSEWKKQPSIFMPRAASRFDLEIMNISCERLQDISERDAIAEGVEYIVEHDCQGYVNYLDENSLETPIESYRSLINLINGKGFWESNPWVWVITFKDITAKK
jgi:hypothetical protein